jgi:NADPH-dependent 2,4-dienoyl-CoA reductase/sulfur reductase-like enzyme
VAAVHRDHGVDVRCGVGVAGLEGERRVTGVRLQDGALVPADVVVVGIGVSPATRWLEGSGLALGDGVLCDAACATSAPHVVAAGDVARWHHAGYGESVRVEHWTHAVEQAAAAAERLLAGPEAAKPFAPVPYVWSDQFELKIQIAGLPRPDDALRLVDGSFEERRFVALFERDGRPTGVVGFGRPRLVIEWRRKLREGGDASAVG